MDKYKCPSSKSISHSKRKIDKYGVNELHISAAQNKFNQVRKCINELQIDVNSRDAGGNSPLHYAARYNSLDAIAVLYEYGADIEAKNNAGQTPLHYGFQAYALDAVEMLRHRGASTKARDVHDTVPASTPRLRTKKNKPIPLLAGLKELVSE